MKRSFFLLCLILFVAGCEKTQQEECRAVDIHKYVAPLLRDMSILEDWLSKNVCLPDPLGKVQRIEFQLENAKFAVEHNDLVRIKYFTAKLDDLIKAIGDTAVVQPTNQENQ